MYAYHYQRPDDTLVFRYDNTPHTKEQIEAAIQYAVEELGYPNPTQS